MNVSPNELLPGARIKATPSGPKRTVHSVVPEPENRRIFIVRTTHGDLYRSIDQTLTLVEALP